MYSNTQAFKYLRQKNVIQQQSIMKQSNIYTSLRAGQGKEITVSISYTFCECLMQNIVKQKKK
jgi:hypothetical protein